MIPGNDGTRKGECIIGGLGAEVFGHLLPEPIRHRLGRDVSSQPTRDWSNEAVVLVLRWVVLHKSARVPCPYSRAQVPDEVRVSPPLVQKSRHLTGPYSSVEQGPRFPRTSRCDLPALPRLPASVDTDWQGSCGAERSCAGRGQQPSLNDPDHRAVHPHRLKLRHHPATAVRRAIHRRRATYEDGSSFGPIPVHFASNTNGRRPWRTGPSRSAPMTIHVRPWVKPARPTIAGVQRTHVSASRRWRPAT